MKCFLKIFTFLILLCSGIEINAQVFRLTPPPGEKKVKLKHRFSSIDTTFLDWQIEKGTEINAENGIVWQKLKENQGFSFSAIAGETLGMMSVEYKYDNGRASGSILHLDIFGTDGSEIASGSLSHSKGISLIGITTYGTSYYLSYEKNISSGNRDLYLAKFSNEAALIWETKVGQRFGTSGAGLLKTNEDGDILLFTQMYDKVSFDILNPKGEIIDRKMIPFINEFSPASFIFNKKGNIVALGSSRKYVNRETISSLVVFELDKQYDLVRYREFGSKYVDLGLDVIQGDDGYYYILANSENLKAPYGMRSNYSTVAKLDEEFKIQKVKRIENKSTGLSLRLAWLSQNRLIFFQRSGERGYGFHLFELDTNLELGKFYNVKGHFLNPNTFIVNDKGSLFLGGGSSKSWLICVQFN